MINVQSQLSEVNLTNFEPLEIQIKKVLDDKNIPQFIGGEHNVVRKWFKEKYITAIKNDEVDIKSSVKSHIYKQGEPEWMAKKDLFDFKGSLPDNVVNEIEHIVDYFVTLEPNDLRKIDKEPYSTIKKKVSDWDKEMTSSSSDNSKEDAAKKLLVVNKDYKIIKEIGQFKWVKLLTDKSREAEGDCMGHCVGGENYRNKDIYSLWDNKNRSHVTIEANDGKKTIKQIKGKGNKRPVEKYIPATIEFVADAMMNGYKVEGDGESIGMIKYNSDYHFDDLSMLPEKYRDKSIFRKWVDIIYPTEIYPKQQNAINAILKRITNKK